VRPDVFNGNLFVALTYLAGGNGHVESIPKAGGPIETPTPGTAGKPWTGPPTGGAPIVPSGKPNSNQLMYDRSSYAIAICIEFLANYISIW
jgi:hypothetical protein